jgi:hypothetical protein
VARAGAAALLNAAVGVLDKPELWPALERQRLHLRELLGLQ